MLYGGSRDEGKEWGKYISASFCVSITAAIGMPKFDAGPQKSIGGRDQYDSECVAVAQHLSAGIETHGSSRSSSRPAATGSWH